MWKGFCLFSYSWVGFKTTRTMVWCADHTALCGPHPHSRLKNYSTTTFFIKFLEKKIFKKRFQEFFFKILKKSIQMNCGGGVRVRTTPHLKKLWLCGPHNHTKTWSLTYTTALYRASTSVTLSLLNFGQIKEDKFYWSTIPWKTFYWITNCAEIL